MPLISQYSTGAFGTQIQEELRKRAETQRQTALGRVSAAKARTGQGTFGAAQRAAMIAAGGGAGLASPFGGTTGGRGIMDLLLTLGKTTLGS